jgi:putative Holliday junction resolvase
VPRFLGIDYGERRIGLALSDPSATIAQALPTLERRRGKRPPAAAVLKLAAEYAAEGFVIGLPLTPMGEESEWTGEVRAFGDRLAERAGLPVHYIDERFTSVSAERAVRSLGLPRRERERKDRVDAAAAVLILQAFLDRRRRDDPPADG